MFCKNCGKEIDDNAVVCPYCGIQVVETKPVETAAATVSEERIVNGLGIAAFIVGMVSFGLGVFFAIASIIALGLSIGAMIKRKKCNACNGMAVAGLIVSIISTVIWGIVWIAAGSALGELFSLAA